MSDAPKKIFQCEAICGDPDFFDELRPGLRALQFSFAMCGYCRAIAIR